MRGLSYHFGTTPNKKNLMRRRTFLQSLWGAVAAINTNRLLSNAEPLQEHLDEKSEFGTAFLVKVLGTAQDGGVPHIGCSCSNCQRAWKEPKFIRLISSLAIFDLKENKIFLVDATPDIRRQIQMIWEISKKKKEQTSFSPDGVLLTHAHIGHYTGLMFFGYEAQSTKELPVFCSKRMAHFLSQNGPWDQLISQKNIAIHIVVPDHVFPITSGIKVEAYQVPHREEYTDTLGYKITGKQKSLLYIPDIHKWEKWERSIVDEVRKADFALLDGTFYSPAELTSRDLTSIGHPFIIHSAELLKNVIETGRNKVFFTHLNHTNMALDPESEENRALEGQGFALALDGMEFYL